jgi:protein involved in polysaccharide export with SLBB domain
MSFWIFRLLAVMALLSLAVPGFCQREELQQLVEQSQEEDDELEQIPGGDISVNGVQSTRNRVRLPEGEEVDRLTISQDREIDPSVYIVGPADVLQLYVWGQFDRAIPMQVNPEGYALVPTIGDFFVSGLTLAEVKDLVITAAEKKYPGVRITLTLVSMRLFTVYVTGSVLREGSFSVHPMMRVSDLIERAGGYLDDLRGSVEETVAGRKVTRAAQLQSQPSGRRTIQLTHKDGDSETIDLMMFLATGGLGHNPYLNMGDVVHVGFRREEVYMYGQINREGVQEYRFGDTIGDLLTLSGGLAGDAPIDEVLLWRFRPDGMTADSLVVARAPGGAGVDMAAIADVPLQQKDMVFIRGRSKWKHTPTVHIDGAVNYRGRYRIKEGVTTIRDLVGQAGGFTDVASLAQTKFIRVKYRNQRDPELNRLQKLQSVSGYADMSREDRAYLKTKGREERGKVAVDFVRLFGEGDDSQNITLLGGDVILVPEKRRNISVSGQVKRPGLIDFQEGRRAQYYLEQSGGYSWNADKGSARLIRARTGLREKYEKNLIVEAGDELWVPEKEYRDWWAFTQSTMRTVAETLTLIILVRSF